LQRSIRILLHILKGKKKDPRKKDERRGGSRWSATSFDFENEEAVGTHWICRYHEGDKKEKARVYKKCEPRSIR